MASVEEIVRRIVHEAVRAALEEVLPRPLGPSERTDELLDAERAAASLGVVPRTLHNRRAARRACRRSRPAGW